MQKVLTAEQMREVDRLTTERYGIPSILLMENAATAVARVITEKLGGSVKGKSILILCGKGNNGGDGAALARILWTQNARPIVLTVGSVDKATGDAKTNFDILSYLNGHIPLVHLTRETILDEFQRIENLGPDAIVDAFFGTGLSRPLPVDVLTILEIIQNYIFDTRTTPVFAVDMPSGLYSDVNEANNCPLAADVTITFTAPKPALVLPPSSALCGEVVTVNIGTPRVLVEQTKSNLWVSTLEDLGLWFYDSRFSESSYKNKRGHALLIAGSESYSGAAVLAGNAAMRSGVGLVTLAVPSVIRSEVAARALPDLIVRTFDNGGEIDFAADSILIGCGLDANDAANERMFRRIVEGRTTPVIVDAGALWFLNPPDGLLQKLARSKDTVITNAPPLILTPHEGEFLRLLGTTDKESIKDRVTAVRDFAVTNNVILVLKGERVLIGSPDGHVVVNPTGNAGLGKAGNGDTLAGILAGFVAQAVQMKIDVFETVVAAVFVAGLAGDVAEKKYGKRVMTASDVRECLADVFEQLGGK